MANLKGVLKCTQEQYNKLLTGETLTIGGKTYTYDENVLYVTEDTQAEPTDAQLAAINSGITSEKVTQIATNTTNISLKQDKLTNTQLEAANSGITDTKVAQIETNATNIAALQTQIGNIDTLLTQIDSGSGV